MARELLLAVVMAPLGLALAGLGLYALRRGRRKRRRGSRIADAETTAVREVGPGTVELKGTARPTDEAEAVPAPISAGKALVTHVAVERYESHGGDGGHFEPIYEETDAVPFLLDDGTGTITVDPPKEGRFQLDLERQRVGVDEDPPEAIRQFLAQRSDLSKGDRTDLGPLSVGERRRYSEGLIVPGDDVYVLGEARDADPGWGTRGYVVDGGTEPDSFVLSDKSEDQLVRQDRWAGAFWYVVAVAFAVLGVALLAVPLIPVLG